MTGPSVPAPPAAVGQPAAAPFDLASYRDRKRVLVLFAPAAGDASLAAEDAAVRAHAAGVADRDLVVVRALEAGESTADGRSLGAADAAALRRRLGAEAGRFTAVLVGKDGHVAFRAPAPVVAGRLFPAIDAMPMRREEVRRRGGSAP